MGAYRLLATSSESESDSRSVSILMSGNGLGRFDPDTEIKNPAIPVSLKMRGSLGSKINA